MCTFKNLEETKKTSGNPVLMMKNYTKDITIMYIVFNVHLKTC